MTCRGCKERMTEPQGLFKMKFIKNPDGSLMKGSPGNYEHGKIYEMPFRFSRRDFWVLLDKRPELVAPELTEADDVFDDVVFVPDDSASVELMPSITLSNEGNFDPNTPATLTPYGTYNPSTDIMRDYEPEQVKEEELEVEELTVTVEPVEKLDRDALIKILDDAGVEIKPRTRTTTLQKMVDKLVAEE